MKKLNVAAISETAGTMGPGRFLAVWLQGCLKRCSGCVNADFLSLRAREWMAPEEIAVRLHSGLTGVSFSGGEPFLQSAGAAAVARLAHERGFATVSYSGYTLEELRREIVPGAGELLAELDILIDGEFVPSLAGNFLWRGSSNQKIHRLSDRFPPEVTEEPATTSLTIQNSLVVTIGTPNAALELLFDCLSESGIKFQRGPSKA